MYAQVHLLYENMKQNLLLGGNFKENNKHMFLLGNQVLGKEGT